MHDAIGRSGERRWLLWLRDEYLASHPEVRKLLSIGKQQHVDQTLLARRRPQWFAVEDMAAPHLIISPLSQSRFRVIRNSVAAIPSNSMYGIFLPTVDDGQAMAEALASWMNSEQGQTSLMTVARRYGGGLFKVEPRNLERAMIPADIFSQT